MYQDINYNHMFHMNRNVLGELPAFLPFKTQNPFFLFQVNERWEGTSAHNCIISHQAHPKYISMSCVLCVIMQNINTL